MSQPSLQTRSSLLSPYHQPLSPTLTSPSPSSPISSSSSTLHPISNLCYPRSPRRLGDDASSPRRTPFSADLSGGGGGLSRPLSLIISAHIFVGRLAPSP
uniref:Uncharacterized protein n=1 Tax=Knipowitschia caucasica TaxID=637954 RepID=A0AAV2L8E8_KNICA